MEAALEALRLAVCDPVERAAIDPAARLAGPRGGAVATAVISYPFVPIPAHIGMTVLSSTVFARFGGFFDLPRKSDFEGVLFPSWRERRLYSAIVPLESWSQVNDPKSPEAPVEVVRQEGETAASRSPER